MRSRALFPESITIVGATETLQQLSSRRSESVHFMRTIGFEDITFDCLILGEFRYLPSYKKAPPTPARQNIYNSVKRARGYVEKVKNFHDASRHSMLGSAPYQ